MIRVSEPPLAIGGVHPLFDPHLVRPVLQNALEASGLGSVRVGDVRLERYWPASRDEVRLEWSMSVRRRKSRQRLFGVWNPRRPCAPRIPGAGFDRGGQWRGICVYLAEQRLVVHTPDADEGLPQFANCLDGTAVAARLHGAWGLSAERGARFPDPLERRTAPALECRVLGYRAGRRAVVQYTAGGPACPWAPAVGKTYRDARAVGVLQRHMELNRQLAQLSRRRVRVPAALGYVPDLQMGLFACAKGVTPVVDSDTSARTAAVAMADGLAALHQSGVDGLPEFTPEHEWQVVERWFDLLQRVHPELAEQGRPLLDMLRSVSADVRPGPLRSIHRDFYSRQILVTRRTTTLLDLDTLARGEPAVDLGNWLAHAYLDGLSNDASARQFAFFWRTAAETYAARGERVSPKRLAFYGAAAAFRVGAVHALRSAAGGCTPRLWSLARELAATARTARCAVPAALREAHAT